MKSAVRTRRVLDTLEAQHPGADTELRYATAFELLVATILSAQSTDQRVNLVTPALFARYPDARTLAGAAPGDLEALIRATGFFRTKARSLIGMARALVERHDAEVPSSIDSLTDLPGVGRKTANVVLGHALGVAGFPVDRHVLRVANRIGIADSDKPEIVEGQLTRALPASRWTRASDTLILHGRRICRPKPLCGECSVRNSCRYFLALAGDGPPAAPRASKRGTDSRGRHVATRSIRRPRR